MLEETPLANLVVVADGNQVLKQGRSLSDPDVDYTLDVSTTPPTIEFKTATSADVTVQYASESTADTAQISLSVDPALQPAHHKFALMESLIISPVGPI